MVQLGLRQKITGHYGIGVPKPLSAGLSFQPCFYAQEEHNCQTISTIFSNYHNFMWRASQILNFFHHDHVVPLCYNIKQLFVWQVSWGLTTLLLQYSIQWGRYFWTKSSALCYFFFLNYQYSMWKKNHIFVMVPAPFHCHPFLYFLLCFVANFFH